MRRLNEAKDVAEAVLTVAIAPGKGLTLGFIHKSEEPVSNCTE